jgi:predicted HicB family RNase H-like nuclease
MVRVEDELWEAAKAAANADGTTVSAVIRDALRKYVKRKSAQ